MSIIEKQMVKLEVEDLDKLTLGQVRDMLDEIKHSFKHLERSQEELLDALQQEADEDLAQAYWENIEVLEKKKAQMEKISKYLEENDFAYVRHQEHNDTKANIETDEREDEDLDDEDGSIASMIASRTRVNTEPNPQHSTADDTTKETESSTPNQDDGGLYL